MVKVSHFFHLRGMKKENSKVTYFFLLLTLVLSLESVAQERYKTENIILVTLDGMRWQEVFNGADSLLMKQQNFLKDPDVKKKYWRNEIAERRKALFPFLWTTVLSQGQIYGNRLLGSKVNVTNQMWFSYPGYNEILTGFADDARITSNDKDYNPNITVLEFINRNTAFKGKVAAFTSWDVFPYIINDKRSGVVVNAGLTPAASNMLTDREEILNEMMPVTPNPIPDVRLDAFTFYYGMEYLKKSKPRVLFFSFDETDDFAHDGEYAAYLNSAHAADGFLKELWRNLQADSFYKNKTTMLITVDHGRGVTSQEWKSHGRKILDADQIWFAVIGPDTPASGEQKNGQVYQNQFAKTITSLLGLNYAPEKKAGESVAAAIKMK